MLMDEAYTQKLLELVSALGAELREDGWFLPFYGTDQWNGRETIQMMPLSQWRAASWAAASRLRELEAPRHR